MARLVLGLDSSTQSISAVVVDIDEQKIVHEAALNFSESFPHYQTTDGVLRHEDPTVVHAPPLMWVEALDALCAELKTAVDLSQVEAITGSGQQHGTVYLNKHFKQRLATLDSKQSLHEQLADCFSRATAPIWMDASTAAQCAALEAALGGAERVCARTGSVAVERFSGPQIKKFAEEEADAYAETDVIALVSSFMASILAGSVVGVDYGDASGTNLLDIEQRAWDADALACCGDQLAEKLDPAVDPRQAQGSIDTYFVERFGFAADCQVFPFSGDNPCSVIGLGLVQPGMTAISLGTSDTLFGIFDQLPSEPSACAHTFVAPQNDYMLLLCFKNGSLAREQIRQQFDLDWEAFSAAVESAPVGNNGGFMLPWFDTEIVPKVLSPGIHVHGLDEQDAASMCRGVIESQMLSMRLHAAEAGLKPAAIRATGGASANRSLLQIMADVFQCPVDVCEISNGAALGAAIRAFQGLSGCTWQKAVSKLSAVMEDRRVLPRPEYAQTYAALLECYADLERHVLAGASAR